MTRARLVLASTSTYRRSLIERLGLPVEARSPNVDERALERAHPGLSTTETAAMLALEKAKSLAASSPDALIVGADQIAEIEGERLHKPGSVEAACAQLRRLSGRSHRLVTAVTVLRANDLHAETEVDIHTLSMRPLRDAAIARYVERDRPLDCAGAYKIESLGIALFERTDGRDFTAIVGLPLTVLVTLLARFGVDVLDG